MNTSIPNIIKFKAFIINLFMIATPVAYIVFYLIMSGREDFSENKLIGWCYIFISIITIETFFIFFNKGQTLGYKNHNIYIINESGIKLSILKIFSRNIIFFIFIWFNWIIMLIRKDNKGLHDILTKTYISKKFNTNT